LPQISIRLHKSHIFGALNAQIRPDAHFPGDISGGHFADGERLPSSSAQVGFISGAG